MRIENVYVHAGGDIPARTLNPKFGQKLDFVERMKRWSETLDLPTLLVGDFNIGPLPSDVGGHKQLLKVVSPTTVDVDAEDELNAGNYADAPGRHIHTEPAR